MSLFPSEPGTVAYANFALIRRSGVLNQIGSTPVAEEGDYKKFVEATGFDYKRDLDGLMSYSADGDYLFLAEGKFDWERLRAYAKSQGGECRDDVCRAPVSKPGRWFSFYPVNRRLIAVAVAKDEYAASRIRKTAGEPAAVPPAPVWISIPGTALRDVSGAPAGTAHFARLLSGTERVLMTVNPQGDRFELAMDVTCKNAEQAAVLRTDLQNLTLMLQKLIAREKQQANAADLSGVLTAGTFVREDRHVVGKWPVSRSFLESLGRN